VDALPLQSSGYAPTRKRVCCPAVAMGSIAFTSAVLCCSSISPCQALTAARAREHDGQNATVCGIVASELQASDSKGKPTFINLDAAYPDQIFTVVVWEEDRPKLGALPRLFTHMCAKGIISYFHGVPQIVVRNREQMTQ
jgi:hypothetical protein